MIYAYINDLRCKENSVIDDIFFINNQVSFQLKPSVCSIGGSIKLPTSTKPAAIQEEDEWDPDSDSDVDDSDEYEVEYEYVSDEDSDSY